MVTLPRPGGRKTGKSAHAAAGFSALMRHSFEHPNAGGRTTGAAAGLSDNGSAAQRRASARDELCAAWQTTVRSNPNAPSLVVAEDFGAGNLTLSRSELDSCVSQVSIPTTAPWSLPLTQGRPSLPTGSASRAYCAGPQLGFCRQSSKKGCGPGGTRSGRLGPNRDHGVGGTPNRAESSHALGGLPAVLPSQSSAPRTAVSPNKPRLCF